MGCNKLILGGLGLAAAALVGTSASAANLVSNGSFEDKSGFVADSNDTMTLGAGSTTMNGWTVITNDTAWIGPSNPFGITAQDGDYSLDLQGYSDGSPYSGVTQNLSTVNGAVYELTFQLGSFANAPTGLTASAGTGSQTFTTTAQNAYGWQQESLTFTATGASTLLTLQGVQANNAYIGLDNVDVTCLRSCSVNGGVPEPATWAMLIAGVFSVGGAIRSRRAKPASLLA